MKEASKAIVGFEEKVAIITACSILVVCLLYLASMSAFYPSSIYASAGIVAPGSGGTGTPIQACPLKVTCADCPKIFDVANKEYVDGNTFNQRITWATDLETTSAKLYYRRAGSGSQFKSIASSGTKKLGFDRTEYEVLISTSIWQPSTDYEYYVKATNPAGKSSVSVRELESNIGPKMYRCYKIGIYRDLGIPTTGMTKKATITSSDPDSKQAAYVLNSPNADLDTDGKREWIFGSYVYNPGPLKAYVAIFENTNLGADTYVEVFDTFPGSGYPAATGDSDGDGLQEIMTSDEFSDDHTLSVLESPAVMQYPSNYVWNTPDGYHADSVQVADLDKDGKKELVVCQHDLKIFENTGDNTYDEVFSASGFAYCQLADVTENLDGDGRGGFAVISVKSGMGTPDTLEYRIYKNTGDDAYQLVWSRKAEWGDYIGGFEGWNSLYFNDMNGDGLEELITGGYSTEEPFTNPNLKFFVIEPRKGGEMGDYEITHEFEFVTGAGSDIIQFTSSIGSIGTDIDSDSKKEVAVGYATLTGDDSTAWYILERDETQFRPIWYHLTAGEASYRGLATGDGDQDRHWELVFNEPNYYTFALYEHD